VKASPAVELELACVFAPQHKGHEHPARLPGDTDIAIRNSKGSAVKTEQRIALAASRCSWQLGERKRRWNADHIHRSPWRRFASRSCVRIVKSSTERRKSTADCARYAQYTSRSDNADWRYCNVWDGSAVDDANLERERELVSIFPRNRTLDASKNADEIGRIVRIAKVVAIGPLCETVDKRHEADWPIYLHPMRCPFGIREFDKTLERIADEASRRRANLLIMPPRWRNWLGDACFPKFWW
jgi:hypothetical protein